MSTTYAFKGIHDLPEFYPCANTINVNANGSDWTSDLRQTTDRHPLIFNNNTSQNALYSYNPYTDGHLFLSAISASGSGTGCIFVPSAGPNGTITTGATTTSVALSTALPAAVGVNQLANRGDGTGYKIRITGNASGSSGKTEEQFIVGNTAGTTPTITLANALSFTPASGDRYEILSGRVFIMSNAAWKYWDVACNVLSAALTSTNLTFPSSDSRYLVFDELYVPQGQTPGQGFFGNLTATATSSTTLTGTGSAADASLQSNEYANFQIRIVTDTGTPTSVGQRRKITSHTAANPTVYTISSAWTVTPSATATYVIEAIGDIALFEGGTSVVYTYAAGGFRADASWSTGATNGGASLQIPNRPASGGNGAGAVWPFGMSSLDSAKNARYSMVYHFRGGNVNTIDVLDIATLSWSTGAGGNDIAYGNKGSTNFQTSASYAYDPIGNNGNYIYINVPGMNGNSSSLQWFARFDVKNRTLQPWNQLRQAQGGTINANRMCMAYAIDGSAYGPYLFVQGASQTSLFRCLLPN